MEVKRIETLINKIKPYALLIGWISSLIALLWAIFVLYYKFEENLKVIQKSTLRNTIWNENIPMSDRLESCDSYLELGYNSITKKYCNELLEKLK